jgi:hypothetical protein
MTIYYVYAYIRQSDNTPYYIGKGKKRRAYSKYHNVSVPKDQTKIVFLEKNLTELGALALERRYIKWYGRKDIGTGILYNRTDGGDTTTGYVPTEETRKKLSDSGKGKKRSVEFCENLSRSRKGHQVSEETRKKISDSKKGVKLSEEHISKTRRIGIPQTEHQKQTLRELRQKTYMLTDPLGNIINITNLSKFCRENNLDQGNMHKNNIKGWTCKKVT